MDELVVDFYQDALRPGLVELKGLSELSPQFNWIYSDCPALADGENGLWVIRTPENTVAATLGTIRQDVLVGRRLARSVFLQDLFVSSDWRRHGLATRLLEHIHSNTELMLMLGMTEAAYRVYMRLGYTEIERLTPLFRITNLHAFIKDIVWHGSLRRIEPLLNQPLSECIGKNIGHVLGAVRSVGDGNIHHIMSRSNLRITSERPEEGSFDELWAIAGPTHRVVGKRDAAFIKWRYWQCPVCTYGEYYAYRGDHLVGYAFSKRYRTPFGVTTGVLVDLFLSRLDTDCFDALTFMIVKALEKAGVDFLKAAFSDPWARSRLRTYGFIDPSLWLPEERRPGPLLIATGPSLDWDKATHDINNWWLTRGDSEQDFNDMPGASEMLNPES